VSEATIRIAYDGEALRSGAMDVRDLAPALIALSDLLDESSKLLNGKDTAVQLRVRSDFKGGSFEIRLEVVQTFAAKIIQLFNSSEVTGALNLAAALGLVGGATAGLVKLVKWLRGRPVKKIEIVDQAMVRIIIEGDSIIVESRVARLLNDVGIRRILFRILAPLERDGVDTFEVRSEQGETIERITREDLPAYAPPQPAAEVVQEIVSNNYNQAFTLVNVAFRDGNKWRVSDGQNTLNVTIADEAFLARVNNHQVGFLKDDTILCEVSTKQTIGGSGLTTEHTIVKVHEHRHQMRQQVFEFPPPPEKL